MPRYLKYNDAVDYSKKMPQFSTIQYHPKDWTWDSFTTLCDNIAKTSGYKIITLDTWNGVPIKDAPIYGKTILPEGW